MNKEETKQILGAMMAAYPNFKPNNIPFTVETWASMLSDYDYQAVSMALKSYIVADTSGFAPSIGQIVGMMQKINTPEEPSELEAWASVSRALRNGSYHSTEEFENLHPLVQKALGSPSNLRAMAIDEGYNEMVAQSNFIRNYRTVVQRNQELQRMPSEARQLIESVNEQLRIGGE